MAFGDIHNHNGSVCKAQKRPCPLGDEGHSKSIEEFVEHHVEESGLDGDAVRSMIADGTPPADAIDVAKGGGGSVAQSISYVDLSDQEKDFEDEMNQQNLEEAYGYLNELEGNERKKEVARAEGFLAADYAESMYEAKLSAGYDDDTDVPANPNAKFKADRERIQNSMKESLAAIHNVSKDKITTDSNGITTVKRDDGYNSIYHRNFALNKVQKNVSERDRADEREIDEETYSYIRELKGDERKREVADVEYHLASAYQESVYEAQLVNGYGDGVPKNATNEYKADVDYIREGHRNALAMIHDVPYDKVTENDKGEIEISRGNGMVSVYKNDFTFKDVEDR